MTRSEKETIVQDLKAQLSSSQPFFLTDAQGMNVASVNAFRRACHAEGVTYKVVKNTLLVKALAAASHTEVAQLETLLKGFTGILIPSQSAVGSARLLKGFRTQQGLDKPQLKAAYVEETLYVGDESLLALTQLKSKNEWIAEVVAMLQSPIQQVIGGLTVRRQKIAALLKGIEQSKEPSAS